MLTPVSTSAMITPTYRFEKKHVMFFGERDIRIASSLDLISWDIREKPVLSPRAKYFDNEALLLGSVIESAKGILVLYYIRKRKREGDLISLGGALFDKKYPSHLLWRSDKPLWQQGNLWQGKSAYPMGVVNFKGKLILYIGVEGDAVYATSLESFDDIIDNQKESQGPRLTKHTQNPIITPVLKHIWEANATFNTAAIYEAGKVHFVYRAMGPHNTSVLGYASSTDGIAIDERLNKPIYLPTEPFEYPGKIPSIPYMSGGGYGGCEDPRLTRIDDRLYMTYVAYNGSDPPRIALTSIHMNDFVNKCWNWEKPKIISSPNIVNKNCVLFPDKINGKYVFMHRIFPDILIDFVDDLSFKNTYLTGQFSISPRYDSWDSRKLGAGAPPIRTKDGWLLIYQAVDEKDAGRYKIGAMLLDLNNPAKVLYRPHTPILEPTEWYENEGFKAGVTYPCGAVVIKDRLLVYYGGADTVICAASTQLDAFLHQIKGASATKEKSRPVLHKIQQNSYMN